MEKKKIEQYIDHTLLSPTATPDQIEKLCQEALTFGFFAVCVHPSYVPLCKRLLEDSPVTLCTVIGFPLGADAKETKAFGASLALRQGALEIDMVMNTGAFKGGDYQLVKEDIQGVVAVAQKERDERVIIKVIIETCYLSSLEIEKASLLVKEAGADFVKSSTGFGSYGAREEDIRLIQTTLGPGMGIKASGGIRSLKDCLQMIEAGATRIGTSSGVHILKEEIGGF